MEAQYNSNNTIRNSMVYSRTSLARWLTKATTIKEADTSMKSLTTGLPGSIEVELLLQRLVREILISVSNPSKKD
jgi:hypothetical protein